MIGSHHVVDGGSVEAVLERPAKVLKCINRQFNKLGKQMSAALIRGSMTIWRQDICEWHEENSEEEQKIIQEEIIEMEKLDAQEELPREREDDQ
jgi:hypothetical protein